MGRSIERMRLYLCTFYQETTFQAIIYRLVEWGSGETNPFPVVADGSTCSNFRVPSSKSSPVRMLILKYTVLPVKGYPAG